MTYSNHATSILAKYWDRILPVNLMAIASKLGVTVVADPTMGHISGHYSPTGWNGTTPLITYNSSEQPVRQRFTIAHELGHHVLRHGECDRGTPSYSIMDPPANFMTNQTDTKERDANAFAAELLMPTEAVESMVQVRGITNLYELAKLFHVSSSAMHIRLKKLGYNVQ